MEKSILLEIGLSEKEAEVYLLITKYNEITASKISKLMEESRTHVYDTLNKLLEKGLISYIIKDNAKYFKSINPERLLDYLKDKHEKIKAQEKKILKIIPELKKIQSTFKEDFKIEVYEGKEGIKTIMNDILKEGKEAVVWGATSKVRDYVPDFFIEKYLNERKKKNIKARQLFTDFYGVLESPVSENRKLPKEFASPTTTMVYGDKVSIWFWLDIPRLILIQNKDLAKSYKKHFELMWAQAKK
jgi:sugar-specific transcriptional regulator TrmB